ncbi:PAS-domain containing protein [Acidisphaera sp. L21]|uniref:PAS-domain containing protein n=1 Tax=Acidisphaera sp. L21 TaxID=1641851 RepID=UPI00131BF390|nr:PAS-domain containing protein [Acidisphaera sp. L21]
MAAQGRTLRSKTLKGVVIAAAIIMAMAAWIAVLVVTDLDREQQFRQAQSRASNLALAFEEQVYRQILAVDQNLRVLKSDWERDPAKFDYTALQRRATSVSDVISQLMMIDSRGKVVATTRREQNESDMSGRRYFEAHRSTRIAGPLLTGPFQYNGAWFLNFSRRLDLPGGGFGGVVAASYDLNTLTQDMSQADLGPRGMIMLVGRDGIIRALSIRGKLDPGGDIRNTDLYHAMFDGEAEGWVGVSGPDRDTRIHAWRMIPGQSMALVVGLDRDAALTAAATRKNQAVLGATAVTLLVLILAAGVASTISAAATREQRLAADRAILEAANRQLDEARERADEKSLQLGMTLAGMSDGISMFDADLRLVQWNDRYADLNGLPREALYFGLSLQEVIRLQASDDEFGRVDVEPEVAWRISRIQDPAQSPISVRTRPSGAVIEARRTRLPDGGLVTLYTDITARKLAEDAHTRAREQAELAAQEKSRFVAIVSHEIRTPLNVALNSLFLLEQSVLSPAQRQLVGNGRLAGESLMALLNDILDLSRMQVGRLQLRPAPFALRPMLEGIVDLFRYQAEDRGIEFSVAIAPGIPERLMTDSGRLRQALMNLVNNAAKFADPGRASIRVGFASLGGEAVLRFAVRDEGPDIPDLDRARLFRPFSQLGRPGSTGTGLGLAICQLLANLLGGQIGCDTVPGGKEFWLTMPADAVNVPAVPVSTVTDIPDQLPRTRILLVEDVLANQMIVATLLRREGHMVEVAASGLEALEKIRHTPYDLVFMDIFMPGIDGMETAQRIRALPGATSRLPLVALTANVAEEDRAAYLASGMIDVVAKPVERATLLQALARHVWSKQHQNTALPATGQTVPVEPAAQLATEAVGAIDLAQLECWRRGLPAATCDDLFADAVQQLRDMVRPLQEALESGDPAAIKQTTHAMRGVASNYGLSGLAALVRSIAAAPDATPPAIVAAHILRDIEHAEAAMAELPQSQAA